MSATDIALNVIISGVSVSGDIDTHKNKVIVELGNSDRIGKVEFALQNKDGTYKAQLVSGNATVQVDAMMGTVTKTIFRGTLEQLDNEIDARLGTTAHFVGYTYGQELLGLISPDGRQKSNLNSDGTISVTSGEQGMSSRNGMDMVLYVSGVIGSGTTGYSGGVTGGTPQASLAAFMSQYFGRSGDTTGSNSGLAFSFKPYLSGMTTSGAFPGSTYKTWYAGDTGGGGADTNGNYWITIDALKSKHEYAWDVLRKLTRQGLVIDRSGFKAQFETYIGVSGDINLITSGTSNFISSGVLIYYQAGQSGSANNNILNGKVPFDTTPLKDEIVAWFPVWTQYPFSDDFSDAIAYSGGYWSGAVYSGTVAISGTAPAPGAAGLLSIVGVMSGERENGINTFVGFDLVFTLWSGYTINIQKWNVSGGNGVGLNYLAQPTVTSGFLDLTKVFFHNVAIYDANGNAIIKSGNSTSNNFPLQLIQNSGWTSITDLIYTASGTFFSGTGQDGGWAMSGLTWSGGAIKKIVLGIGSKETIANDTSGNMAYNIDNISFQFAYDYSPVVTFSSGSIFAYGRRYEVFEFPYQVTDSGATSVVLSELQSKSQSRQLAEFTVKDNPNVYPAQLNITPGQAFIVDAPSLNTGSGQTFFYWRATEVRHEWSHQGGFITLIRAYPWTSGGSAQSGQNLISYSLPLPAPAPRVESQMPNTHWWGAGGGGKTQ